MSSVSVAEKEEVVEKKEYAPRFNPGLEDTTVNVGQAIRLSCSVDAIPKAGVSSQHLRLFLEELFLKGSMRSFF